MLSLFKRTKKENWEIQLLRNVVINLPDEYSYLLSQINDNLLKGVIVEASDIPGYVAFTFCASVLKKHEKASVKDFKLTNIKVFDTKTLTFLPYEIYISHGTISGYSIGGNKKKKIDVNKIDTYAFKRELISESVYDLIANLLTPQEKELLNPSQIYSVFIDDKEYFHIKDLEDGDFIGIDERRNVYKITHNLTKILALNKEIIDILKS
ncbi:hypothetical protein ACFSR2_12975 [Emticicia soli]|uniref:DUF3137 domain-containing protein n=1 Tax=Emticicia soli TaxID=2027878 RepID=A0ABW5J8A3_9BACT